MRIKVGDKFQILKAGPWNSSVNTEGTIIRIDRILDGGAFTTPLLKEGAVVPFCLSSLAIIVKASVVLFLSVHRQW